MARKYRKLQRTDFKRFFLLTLHDSKSNEVKQYRFFQETDARALPEDLNEIFPDRFSYSIEQVMKRS